MSKNDIIQMFYTTSSSFTAERIFLVLCLAARPWGLLVACAFGGSALDIPIWAMALIGLAGIAVFLLGMKYGDKLEQAILDRLKK